MVPGTVSAPRTAHRLRVDDRCGGLRVAAFVDAHEIAQGVVDLLPDLGPGPASEDAVDGLVRREVMGQRRSGDTAADQVEDRVKDPSAGVFLGAPTPAGVARRRQQRLEHYPLGVGDR